MRAGVSTDEYSASIGGQSLQFGEVFLYRLHGFAVKELCRGQHTCAFHLGDGFTGGLGGGEEQQRRCGEWCDVNCLDGDRGEECQGAFRTYHEVGYDVKWVIILHERQNSQSRNILDAVFAFDALGECDVLSCLLAQFFYLAQERGVAHGECCTALLIASVEQCAIGQDDTHGLQYAVAIGVYATAHTAGVVHHDATHHSRFETGRVRGEVLAVWAQNLIDALPHDTGLQGDGFCIFSQGVLFPFLAAHYEQTVADGLSAQAGTSSTEGDVFTFFVCTFDDGLHICFCGRV